MINVTDVLDQGKRLTEDKFKDTLDETYNRDRNVMQDRFEHVISLLERLVNYSERQREKDPPEVVELSAISGSQVTRSYSTKTRLRVVGVLITVQPVTDQIRLNVGLRPYNFFGAGYYPFPIDIPQGIDLSAADITTGGSLTFAVYVIGYSS